MILRYFSWTASCRKTLLLLIFSFFSFNIISQETFTVNTTADTEDINLTDNLCKDLNGNCSLRAAIQNANLTGESDNIFFNIAGDQVHTILLNKNLPPVTETIYLDATTQSGYSWNTPKIVIDGSEIELIEVIEETPRELVPSGFILTGNSSGSLIKGVVIGGFGLVTEDASGQTDEYYLGIGIQILNSEKHVIQGNFIGVRQDGFTPFKNVFGITTHSLDGFPDSIENEIGGIGPGEANVIGGSWRSAILLGYKSGRNKISGNFLGINSSGNQPISNSHGISVTVPSYDNNIHDNIVSGNVLGIHLVGDGNRVYNNTIGLGKDKFTPVPNIYGVALLNSKNIVGEPDLGNLISGNTIGVIIYESGINRTTQGNIIQHNYIGTDEQGINGIPNTAGIIISGNNCIENIISNNLVSGNSGNGISIENGANKNLISGNLIGLNSNNEALGNGQIGLRISGNNNVIGGYSPEESNSIAFNTKAGISIIDSLGVFNNKISANRIFNNAIGLDLGNDDVTINDIKDQDEGPNKLQNFPELITANFSGSSLELFYSMDSDPAHSKYPLTIEIFKSDGNRQGKQFIGTFLLTEEDLPKGRSKSSLNQLLNLSSGITLSEGDLILSTATDFEGNTSEFSSEISVSVSGSCTPEIWYADVDRDGFGDPLYTQNSCTQPDGYVKNNTDCDDSDNTVYPGAVDDTVDGIDQNCDDVDGPDTSCTGSDLITVSEVCSTATSVIWEITNPGSCHVDGRWELRKNSSTGDSSGTFSLVAGETIQITSGIVSKGKTQIVVYWNDPTGTELNKSTNASGIACSGSQSAMDSSLTPELFVSPNPVNEGGIGIYFTAVNTDGILNAVIYNSSGQQMASQSFSIKSGTTSLIWDLDHSSWIEGVYILNVTINNETYQAQFIK